MADTISGNNIALLAGAATTLISDHHCMLAGLAVLGTGNGSVIFYNVPTAAGTATSNTLGTVGLTASLGVLTTPMWNINCSNGLVAAVTGTVNIGVLWR